MKKKRGLKKYYKNLAKSFNPECLSFKGENVWFDLYHFHIDNKGLGNRNWKSREQHLDALFSIAENIEIELKKVDKPFQFWIEIYGHNSSSDAVYIHTINPNQQNFPVLLTFDEKIEMENLKLRAYLERKNYVIKTKFLLEDGKPIIGYFLQKNGFGIALGK